MNHPKNLLAAGILLALNAATAQATLFDRGNGLIYDQDLNITWLANANQGLGNHFDDGFLPNDGRMTWQNAVDWADELVYQGFSDWRLPDFTGSTTCYGVNCADSELSHLFYSELGEQH